MFNFLCLTSGSTPTHTSSSNSADRENDRSSAGKRRRSSAKFQPPDRPPARKDWVPDTKQDVCMICRRERFTMVSELNTCRLHWCHELERNICGQIICIRSRHLCTLLFHNFLSGFFVFQFNMRHHCRRCGRLVCQSCSEHKMSVEGCPGDEEVRVCNECYAYFHPEWDLLLLSTANLKWNLQYLQRTTRCVHC